MHEVFEDLALEALQKAWPCPITMDSDATVPPRMSAGRVRANLLTHLATIFLWGDCSGGKAMTKLLALLLIASSCFVTAALATSALTIDERPVSNVMPEGSYQTAQSCPAGTYWDGQHCAHHAACPGRYYTTTSCVNRRLRHCRYFQMRNCASRPMGCSYSNTPCGGAGTF